MLCLPRTGENNIEEKWGYMTLPHKTKEKNPQTQAIPKPNESDIAVFPFVGQTRDWKQKEDCSAYCVTTDTKTEFAACIASHSLKYSCSTISLFTVLFLTL